MKNSTLIFNIVVIVLLIAILGYLVYGYYLKTSFEIERPLVTMEIENYGTVKMELYPDQAPNTVKNFIKLINDGYYNGLSFHRVEKDLLIQGGDYNGDGTGVSELAIDGEFSVNGYTDNTMKFERGTVGLARQDFSYYSSLDASLTKEGYNSGYAQFFIMAQEETGFDNQYTAFGKVIEGIEIVDTITNLETKTELDEETGEVKTTSEPINKPIISSMTVETFGVEYGEPQTHKPFDMNQFLMNYYGLST